MVVIPAKAGIHLSLMSLDPSFRWDDSGVSRFSEICLVRFSMSQLLLDRAIQKETDDHLETGKLADSVESIISLAGEETFSLALYGSWGTGKTSLLNILKERLEDRPPKKSDYIVIWFDTWKYESQPNLILPLLKKLYNKLPSNQRTITTKKLGQNLISILLGFVSKGLGADFDTFKNIISDNKSVIEKFDDQVDFFCQEFANYSEKILRHKKKKRIIIIFDDLDRCSPENMVSLIESVKLFLSEGKNITFIYALDKEIVSQAITNKYSGLSQFDGERYLEKVFDISLNLPRINPPKADKFLNELETTLNPGQKNYLNKLCQHPKANTPRVIKKVVNKILILKARKPDYDHPDLTFFRKDIEKKVEKRRDDYNKDGFNQGINIGDLASQIADNFNDLKEEFLGYILLAEIFGKSSPHYS